MSQRVGVINYGMAGNIRSIQKALDKAGATTSIIERSDEIDKVDKLVIPGVGTFPDAMSKLGKSGLLEPLTQATMSKPTLGICLGMQILSRVGFEFGTTGGLALFDAEVKSMLCDAAVPHMGFSKVQLQVENDILSGLDGEEFYFMHSFEVVNYRNVLALTTYSEHEFVSAIGRSHIYGVQFHPEKSRDAGIQLFKNFISI